MIDFYKKGAHIRFTWADCNFHGNGMLLAHDVKLYKSPRKKAEYCAIKIENYYDTYEVDTKVSCPTGWFYAKNFYGHDGYVKFDYRMKFMR